MSDVVASAKVIVQVEISNLGAWDKTCTIEQLQRQATEEAMRKISRVIHSAGYMRVVGAVEVQAVYTKPRP